jgi:hypothetical protein
MNDAVDFSQLPLRDIHLPGAVGFWPPAVGWWLVALLVLAAAAAFGLYYYRGRHRRVALRSMKRVRAALEQGAEPVVCLQMVSTVLRRFAMTTARPEGTVPGLIGDEWLKYLDSRWQRHEFAKGLGRRLLAAPYGRPNSLSRDTALELTTLCTAWLMAQPRTARASGA